MQEVVVVLALIVLSVVGFVLTKRSVENLKTGVLSFYPFNLFIPKSNKWSVFYFLVSITFLFLLLFFLSEFVSLRPA